jgi:DNA-directed RNA polymerase specialized sigma24 family protein
MVNMTPKEFLEEYRKAGGRIIRITAELEELQTRAELPGHGFEIMVKTTPRDRVGEVVPTLTDEKAELEDERRKARRICWQVKKAIAAVRNEKYREVLTYIYVCGFTHERVSALIGCDTKTIQRRRDAALMYIKVPKNIF